MEDVQPAAAPTARSRPAVAALLLAAFLAIGIGLFGVLGVAGWRGGWLLALAWFAVGGGLIAWWVLGPPLHRREVRGRGFYTAAVVVIGITLAVRCTAAAPESAGRLAQRLDGLPLQFWESTGERRSGNGWCRPTCPTVTRTYRGPALQPRFAKVHVAGALRNQGLLPDIQLLLAQRQNERLDDETDETIVKARMKTLADGHAEATITLIAKR